MQKKFISWNVNGIRACLNKGFMDAFAALDADIFCLQETKVQPGQATLSGKKRDIPARRYSQKKSR